MVQEREGRRTASVTSIQTEYVRSLRQKVNQKNARRVRLYRRLTVFSIAAVIILSLLTHTLIGQKKILSAKMLEKEAVLEKLASVEEEQLMLTRQIANLNDDEYIAKLARQEYFLSEKNEIIFSMPKNNEKDKKKVGEKE